MAEKPLLLVCQHPHCGEELPAERGELPPTCPGCKQHSRWMVLVRGVVFTRNDKQFLKGIRISPS